MAQGDKQSRNFWKPAGLALVVVLAVLAAGEASRAANTPTLIISRILSAAPEDLPFVREASAPLFDATAAGVGGEWSNPQTGNSGTVELHRIFALRGMPCRTFEYTTWTEGHTFMTRVVIDWCKVAEDGWKMVDPREPAP